MMTLRIETERPGYCPAEHDAVPVAVITDCYGNDVARWCATCGSAVAWSAAV